jgi:predicted DNA binding CopG/RHH family protein
MATKKTGITSKAAKAKAAEEFVNNNPLSQPVKDNIVDENMKRLTIDVPELSHRKIKLKSINEGVTMVQLIREILNEKFS